MAVAQDAARRSALRFIVLCGVISLFADMTYEGARSITGPYLGLLGASAAVVGALAGAGELTGYALRLASGWLADRTRRYWTLTLAGYAVNLLAAPLLAFAGRWEVAALLILLERAGKGLRTPARDAMLSHASRTVGTGWGFGLHEAMDQIGAVTGPLIVAAAIALRGDYRLGFAVLFGPAMAALAVLVAARLAFPRPAELEVKRPVPSAERLPRAFWLYLAATGLLAAGYADFPLIAFHLSGKALIADGWIPILYAGAMAVDAIAALAAGCWFDRLGVRTLAAAALASAFAAPLAFTGGRGAALAGLALWGIGMGAQESVMRAAVAEMTPPTKRGTAYGVFHAGYGICWFAGSALMGALYDVSIAALAAFSVAAQLAAAALLLWLARNR